MAETSPPPAAGAESCSEEPAGGGEQQLEELRRARAGDADREGDAGPPEASPGGQSEPDSPVAAPFFLLYPGDGGAGFAARPPPPPQQRAWRTPPSPGSPLPFLLLSYPSGGGKHREWRRGTGRAGPGPRSSASLWVPERGAGPRGGGGAGEAPVPGRRGQPRSRRRVIHCLVSPGRGLPPGLPSSPGPGARPRHPLPCSPGPRPGPGLGVSLPWRSRGGAGAQRLSSPAVPPSAGSRRRGSQVGVAAAPPLGRPQLYF